MTAADITARPDSQPPGSGWVAECPAHEDHSHSRSIHERNGKVLLHYHAGGSVEAVGAVMGIPVSNLFTEQGKAQTKPLAVREAEKQVAEFRSRLTSP